MKYTIGRRSLVSAIACGLGAAIMAGPARAIDYQPFDWVPLPPGTKVLSLYYEYGAHDSYNNTIAGTFDHDTNLDSHIGIARYIHYGAEPLFGHQWDWNVIVPFGTLRDGKINGQELGNANGFGDPVASIGYFLVSDPEQKTWLTFAPYITIPIGSYDRNKALNLGGNRWVYNFQGDFTQGIGDKFTVDLAAGWTWYGDNTEAGNGRQRLTQDTSYELYGWLAYDVSDSVRHVFPGASNARVSIGYMGIFGGEQQLDGISNGQKARQDQLRAVYMMNFSPTTQGLIEVTHDMHFEGQFKQNFGLTLRLVKAL
ncbi:MAG TPA: transporter [Rudaea sp.]|nr:transporter [Rudaea sp.]